jgi:secreted PhoX family phosphatase
MCIRDRAKVDERFDVSKNPNEPNRAGYVVEIDPFDPTSTPKKRTALGRFKHENAAVVIAANGKAVVYLGDDERGEFLYKFVSHGT